MLLRAVNFCRGHVTLRVESGFPERVLNLCAARGIGFWDLRWESELAFTFTVSRGDWRRLGQLEERLGARITPVEREGVPFFLLRFRRRHWLVAGMAAAAALIFFGSFFIWDFSIEGNVTVSREEILRSLDRHGVGLGTFGYSIDSRDLRNRVLLDIPELSYIAVNVRGCRAYVQVRERVEAPEIVSRRRPGNTVAARDGLVTAVQPWDGQKMVLPGTMVTRGQLLISGVVDDDQAGTRFLRGMGQVYARTWYELRCQVPLTAEEKVYTGEEETRWALCWGDRRINFYGGSSIDGESCDKIVERTRLSLPGGYALPLTVVRETLRPYTLREVPRDREEAEAQAGRALEQALLGQLEDGEVLSSRLTSVEWDGGLLVVLSAECREQIGRFEEIPVEEE